MDATPHLDDNAIVDLQSGRLGAAAQGVARAHLERCAACRQLVDVCREQTGRYLSDEA